MTAQDVISFLADAIYDSVKEAGSAGAPEGLVYTGLLSLPGMNLEIYGLLLSLLKTQGRIRISNNCIFAIQEPI